MSDAIDWDSIDLDCDELGRLVEIPCVWCQMGPQRGGSGYCSPECMRELLAYVGDAFEADECARYQEEQ